MNAINTFLIVIIILAIIPVELSRLLDRVISLLWLLAVHALFILFFLSFFAQTPLIIIKLTLRRAQTASWHFTCLCGYRRLWTLLTTSWGPKLWNPGKTWIPQNKVTPPQCYWIHWRKERLSLPRTWSSRRLSKCLRRTSVSSFSACVWHMKLCIHSQSASFDHEESCFYSLLSLPSCQNYFYLLKKKHLSDVRKK